MSATAYERPSSLPEALQILSEGSWCVAAGCTDLFPATERKILPGPVLDITALEGLRGVSRVGDGVRIGATTTWSDIMSADLPAAFDGLKLAARDVGATQIQNRGTLAGNLCNASPAADGVPALLTLDAQVELSSKGGTRHLPLSQFITGPRQTALMRGELLTALHIPGSALQGQSAFRKLGARDYLVISIAMTAVRLVTRDGKITDAALSVGSCGPVATRLPALEARLSGQPIADCDIADEDVQAAISPIDDIRADAVFRVAAAAELLRRTLGDLAKGAV